MGHKNEKKKKREPRNRERGLTVVSLVRAVIVAFTADIAAITEAFIADKALPRATSSAARLVIRLVLKAFRRVYSGIDKEEE